MDIEQLNFSFEAMRWILTAAIGSYAWFVGRQSASAKELLEIRTRLITLESQMKQVPSTQELHVVSSKLERIDERMSGIAESLQPISRSLDRVNAYLLNHK
ncbi:MAG: DUF2730 domain-containing protein [Gammaproteobacteria bacterium HGW-Gammaproteobacteria-11]|nr:MAG: DUF2730 domain-containing protein [Gammaproteobacteria bacterium HGW-Gammaproteobacteria-11]